MHIYFLRGAAQQHFIQHNATTLEQRVRHWGLGHRIGRWPKAGWGGRQRNARRMGVKVLPREKGKPMKRNFQQFTPACSDQLKSQSLRLQILVTVVKWAGSALRRFRFNSYLHHVLCNLFVPQFPLLYTGEDDNTYLIELLRKSGHVKGLEQCLMHLISVSF